MALASKKVAIKKLSTGVPGLDAVLGGGIPAYSMNMVVGAPGAGKTTLTQQILSHVATPDAKALCLIAMGEPTIKMLRYLQQYDFFDVAALERSLFFVDVGTMAREEGLKRTLEVIAERVAALSPAFVSVDSFKGLKEIGEARGENIRTFTQDFASILAVWSATTFLLGEYTFEDTQTLSEFSVADGVIHLSQMAVGNAAVRKLQVLKMRGQGTLPGKHGFRIDQKGIEVFPRMVPIVSGEAASLRRDRVPFGVPGLDEMMHGGLPRGETALIAGSSGTGKTLLSLHFIAEGIKRRNEPAVMVTFEESPREHERKALSFGWDLAAWTKKGLLEMIYLRPLDVSVEEVLARIHQAATKLKAKRVVINSISGFELVISPSDQPEFREALFRLVATMSAEGITTVMTTEIPNVFGEFTISPQHISFLADSVIILRYAEIESKLRKVMMVVKMRTSEHDTDLRQYTIGKTGVIVEKPFTEYSGVLSGIPTLRAVLGPQPFTAGLSASEETLMNVLLATREATAQQLADSLGLGVDQVRAVLEKLVDTGYVVKGGRKEEPKYRIALITPRRSVQ